MKQIIIVLTCLLITISAQAQWVDISTGKTSGQFLCAALSDSTCVSTNYGDRIYRTTDAGMNFDSTDVLFPGDLFGSMCFPNDSVGYIGGGTFFGQTHTFVLKTTDAGQTWDSIQTSISNGQMVTFVSFIDGQIGFVGTDDGLFFRTTDGAQTLTATSIVPGAPSLVTAVDFADANTGYASTSRVIAPSVEVFNIHKSTDQGLTWTVVYADTLANSTVDTDRRISSLGFLNAMEGYAGGTNGRMMKTTDGGASWSIAVLVADSSNLTQVHIRDAQNVVVTAQFGYGGAGRRYFTTTDAGASWVRQAEAFNTMSFAGNVGYAVGPNGTLFRNDTDFILSTEDLARTQVDFYPNPASSQGYLRITPELLGESFMLVDLKGRIVKRGILRQVNTKIELEGLSPGTYLLRVEGGKHAPITKKVLLMHR